MHVAVSEPGAVRKGAIPHISALDGARGAAVAGVLLFHGGHLRGGYLGVDFFFTLSGFLITSLLLAESSRTGSIGLGGFWARRARRLLPALAVLMVGVALYCVVFADSSQLAQIRGDAFATLAYGANWRAVYAHQDYWALFTAPSPLNHTWSLAIEEQFYVVWPLVFVGLLAWWKRATPKAVLVTSLVLACVSSILLIAFYDPLDPARSYYGTDARAAAILFGAALAAWLAIRGPTTSRRARIWLEVVGFTGAVILAIEWTRLPGQSSTLYHGGFLLCGLAGTAVIAAAVHPTRGALARWLSWRPLCALGLISYGVYLYHWPIDIVVDETRVGFGGWPLVALQIAVTLAVAVASYVFVEQPIRRGALSTARLARLTPAVAFGLVVALFVVTLGARPPGPRIPTSALPGDHPLEAAAAARKNAPFSAKRIMVAGDSVGNVLTGGLVTINTAPPVAVFSAAHAGCTFPSVSQIRVRMPDDSWSIRRGFPCDPKWEAGALRQFRPDVVLWVVSNPYQEVFYKDRWIAPCTAPYESLYRESLRQTIANLGADGARVVITTTAYWRPTGDTPYAGIKVTGLLDRYTDCDNRLRRKVAAETGTKLIDLFKYVCPGGKCRTKLDGTTLRLDGLHYFAKGGQLISTWMLDQLGITTTG